MSFTQDLESFNEKTLAEFRHLDMTISHLETAVKCVEIDGGLLEFKTDLILKQLGDQRKDLSSVRDEVNTVKEAVNDLNKTVGKMGEQVDALFQRAQAQEKTQQAMNDKLDMILGLVQGTGKSQPVAAEDDITEPVMKKRKIGVKPRCETQ